MSSPTEHAFETAIVQALTSAGEYNTVKYGNRGTESDLDVGLALDTADLFAFIALTQAEEWNKVLAAFAEPAEAQRRFAKRLSEEIDKRGAIDVLRRGITFVALEKTEFRLAYFRPASGHNAELEANYRANRLNVTRQCRFDPKSTETVDLCLFVNGIPVATAELKNAMTGQSVEDAMAQYRARQPRHRLLRRAIVHFAVDTEQVSMTTRLDGERTRFLPFNRGDGDHAGNPRTGDHLTGGYRTGYLWTDVWSRDPWLDLLARFVFTKSGDGQQQTTLFPRFHQWRAVLRLSAHARQHGTGHSYLVQHSAGSGKSNTIAWLAHRLSSLHNDADEKVFDKVIVITDRLVLDRQLQDTIYQFEHVRGVVEKIDTDSRQLAQALAGEQARIVITTIQKFPFVLRHVDELRARSYAVIIDEAHSSQTGDSAKEMKRVLGNAGGTNSDGSDEDADLAAAEEAENYGIPSEPPDEFQDRLAAEVAARGRQPNLSFFAFTATPKARTLELFGTRSPGRAGPAPYDLYSMRQAIEERFIHDVLESYTTYETYYRIEKAIFDDPNYDKATAAAAIARFVSLHPHNLAQRAEVIVEHFRRHVADQVGGQAKAMVVTASRLHALRYKRALDEYCRQRGIKLGVLAAFSGTLDDPDERGMDVEWTEARVNGFPDSETPARFDTDEYQILIVAEKYQTGFDQPKLYAMYVDKKLTGLAAVQTLSRLNRIHPLKTGTFVLDFRNAADDIQAAFKPWFGETTARPTDPHALYDTRDRVWAFDVLRMEEIDTMVELLLEDPERNHQRIHGAMGPAIDRFWALNEDDQDGFREAVNTFVRVYSFLSQVVSFTDVKLEKEYLFCRRLTQLIRREPVAGVDLGDAIELTHLRLEKQFEGSAVIDEADGEITAFPGGGGGGMRMPDEAPLSEVIAKINERFGTNISPGDRVLAEQTNDDLVGSERIQQQALANDEATFSEGLDKDWVAALARRMATNQDFAGVLLDNEALRAELLAVYTPTIYARAKVAGQRTCPIGELIRSDGESMWLEYKSTLRWDVRKAVKAGYIEDATVKTIAGFANAPFGGTLLVGVADDGTVHGLEDDYATFSKRGERGDRDLWGQHLHNLLGRLGQAATPLVEWEFLSIAGRDIARINVSPSDFPVYETRGDKRTFWQRTPIGTEAVIDPADVEKIIARRWGK